MQKLFFFDLETTGLDSKTCAIHQIAGKVIIDGEVMESFNINVRPFEGAVIEDAALEVGHVTKEQIMGYQSMEAGYNQLMRILDRYVNKYDKKDKFFIAGYNIAVFDVPFLREFFIMNGNNFYGSYFWSVPLDIIILAGAKLMNIRPAMADFKQGTVAKQLGILVKEDSLHDAMYDIDICYEIYKRVMDNGAPMTLIEGFDF